MKKALLVSLLIAGIGLGSLGVASAMSGRPSTGVKPGHDPHACFDPTFVDGFQTPDDHTMIVTQGHEAYKLSLTGVCIGLDTSFVVGIRSRYPMADVCGPFDAEILYRDGDRRQSCQITEVRHLSPEEAAEYTGRKPAAGQSAVSGSSSASSKSNW
ncbi:DUF6491 family protein [Asticcacaulis solisilvae]|uniref:DUF6491 family protein n=1 Tax=Asticcacaulis solisilvae TaxID=1217274 RepID=UPI003FD7C6ED